MSPIERPKKQRGLFPDVTPQEPELARQSIAATTPAGPFQLRQALRWREDVPNSVAWSPDGQFLASGAADRTTVQVWEAATGKEVRILKGHRGSVQSVAWSPDGQFLASGADDSDLRVW